MGMEQGKFPQTHLHTLAGWTWKIVNKSEIAENGGNTRYNMYNM